MASTVSQDPRRPMAEAASGTALNACLNALAAADGPTDAEAGALRQAFADTLAAYWGDWPDYLPCDTPYHDLTHALGAATMAARLASAYARRHPDAALDGHYAAFVVLLALMHDTGFLRHRDEAPCHGATLTTIHEARSIRFTARYLARTPWAALAPAAEVILATRLESTLDALPGADSRTALMFRIVGSADLLAQIVDPFYLERCRDFLYPEFALAGLDHVIGPDGQRHCRYIDGNDLLRQTSGFVRQLALPRLDGALAGLWRCLDDEALAPSAGARIDAILGRLDVALAADDLGRINGQPTPLIPTMNWPPRAS